MPSKFVHLGAHAVHYLHTGATTLPGVPPALDRGALFVLLHCGGGCAAMWQRVIAALGDTHSAVAIDMPAHGRSAGVDGLATIDAGVALLAEFTAGLGLRPFVLVGHSLGASTALAFAAAHPQRLRGLVLANPSLVPDLGNDIATLRQIVKGRLPQQFSPELFSPQSTPNVMREFFTAYVTTDPRVRLADCEAAHGWDGTNACGRLRLPTLVVAGADDRIAPPTSSQAVAHAVAGARFETIEAAGHALPVEQADALSALLTRFAEGLA